MRARAAGVGGDAEQPRERANEFGRAGAGTARLGEIIDGGDLEFERGSFGDLVLRFLQRALRLSPTDAEMAEASLFAAWGTPAKPELFNAWRCARTSEFQRTCTQTSNWRFSSWAPPARSKTGRAYLRFASSSFSLARALKNASPTGSNTKEVGSGTVAGEKDPTICPLSLMS